MTAFAKKMVIIGASDAGISAALAAREQDASAIIQVMSADRFPNFSICGIPFFIGGEVADWRNLAHRQLGELESSGIELLLGFRVLKIEPEKNSLVAADSAGTATRIHYDRLVIGTGAVPVRPRIAGSDLPGVFLLRFMPEALEIAAYLDERAPASALIIGGGYIGMEMAEALHRRGLAVTLTEIGASVMPTLDPDMGDLLKERLVSRGIRVLTESPVTAIEKAGSRLTARGTREIGSFDLILVATGVRPETALAAKAGLHTGIAGAIRVNRRMETRIPGIYAAGDCAETWHRLLGKNGYMPLGSTAHKQGRIAGINAAGGNAEFRGIVGTQVVKVFDRVAARTGLKEAEAEAAGFAPVSIRIAIPDHKAYYPGACDMHLRVTGDRETGRLIGAQIVGSLGSEISKRIDLFATALHCGLTVAEFAELDLSYTPPLSTPWDPVQEAARTWLKHAVTH